MKHLLDENIKSVQYILIIFIYVIMRWFIKFWITGCMDTNKGLMIFSGVSPGDYKDFKPNNPDIKVEDGTLMINNIQKNNEGYYLCEAVNGIGSGLSAVILISVQGRYDYVFYMLEQKLLMFM